MNTVLTVSDTDDKSSAAAKSIAVPWIGRLSTFTTRLFSRVLWTVASTGFLGSFLDAFRGRPGRPVGRGGTVLPYTSRMALA